MELEDIAMNDEIFKLNRMKIKYGFDKPSEASKILMNALKR